MTSGHEGPGTARPDAMWCGSRSWWARWVWSSATSAPVRSAPCSCYNNHGRSCFQLPLNYEIKPFTHLQLIVKPDFDIAGAQRFHQSLHV